MSIVDQNSAWNSLGAALIADRPLIDSRTEQDRLCFLSEFASLINFYDHENMVYGNWTPFILKDPVFLVASISKTRYDNFYSVYQQTCQSLEAVDSTPPDGGVPSAPAGAYSAGAPSNLLISLNQMLDQMIRVFMRIERWTYYMKLSDDTYPLKEDVIKQIRTTFSGYFWAVVGLKQYLYLAGHGAGSKPVKLYLFDGYDEWIWKQGKDGSPFWEVLGFNFPVEIKTAVDIKINTSADILNIFTPLKEVGDELFYFFQATILHSATEFTRLKGQTSRYPDTILLRTFVNLLQIHQDQLNTITHKHLHFYYKDILKQTPRQALPDSVYLCATLARTDAAFYLPSGTVFNAGLDARKNPIWFASRDSVNLNPAVITRAHTLAVLPAPAPPPAAAASMPAPSPLNALYFQDVPFPGVIQTDPDGKMQSWQTFGGTPNPGASAVQVGIGFASPMLLLREGTRTITITLGYTGDLQLAMFQSASYYLSTTTDWWNVQPSIAPGSAPGSLIISTTMQPTDPAIEAFVKNPDGLESPWPMCKIVFHSFSDLSSPPLLTSMFISVNVTGVSTFQLYNDNGALSPKSPFQLLGPTPLLNSQFIFGSNEVFSKPLDTLDLALTWNNLPQDFSDYYQAYNDYLSNKLIIPPSKSWLYKIFHPFKKDNPPPVPDTVQLFNNTCFSVRFDALQGQAWKEVTMLKSGAVQPQPQDLPLFTEAAPVLPPAPAAPAPKSGAAPAPTPASAPPPALLPTSDFVAASNFATQFSADPWIQTTPLKYSGNNTSGFMRMRLTGPGNGFGAALYPSVVYDVVMYNSKATGDLEAPAAPPFAPKAMGLMGNYSASQSYSFGAGADPSAIQWFLYTPLENYTIFNGTPSAPYGYTIQKSTAKVQSGIPLYPSLDYEGYLFLEVQNLAAPNPLNLYVQLSRTYTGGAPGNGVDYFYLSNSGWKTLPLLSDGTNDFCCSGIIKLNVPADIDQQVTGVPGVNECLIAIAVPKAPTSFAQTIYMSTNGFVAQRIDMEAATGLSVSPASSTPVAPSIPAGAITKPQTAIPQISAIMQPFPSFGGKAAEDDPMMHLRISNRLKTKDRAVSAEDYFRLIREEYADIYYARPAFNTLTRETIVYVAKQYDSSMDPNAFIPLVTECKEIAVAKFLTDRASGLARIKVSNFDLQYVLVMTVVDIQPGCEIQGMQKAINDALNLYLSPWITTRHAQTVIDQPVSDAQVGLFIKSLPGVAQVESVLFQTGMTAGQVPSAGYQKTVVALKGSALFVSYMNHQVTCKWDT